MKKKGVIIVILILIILISGFFILKKYTVNPKSCDIDSDCQIKYNIRYNDKCDAGCFNKNAEVDSWCNENIRYESFPPGTSCECVNNICVLKNENS